MHLRQPVFVSIAMVVVAASVVLAIARHRVTSEPTSFSGRTPAESRSVPIDPRSVDARGKQVLRHAAPEVDPSSPARPRRLEPVELRGRIDGEMAVKVNTALLAGSRDFTVNSSNGGLVIAAAAIAGLMSSYDATLTANGTCLSACALMLIGVKRHYYVPSDADIEIHGAFSQGNRAEDKAASESAAGFMVAHGVPHSLAYGRGMGLNMYRLSPADLDSIGIMPVRHIN